jgi:hypothetical protein
MTLEERIQQMLGAQALQLAALATELEKAKMEIERLKSDKGAVPPAT